MEERRRTNRRTLVSSLVIKRLDGSGQEEAEIEIVDVSKTGIGFTCSKLLDIGAVYESFLRIWTQEVLHAFLEIVRIEKKGKEFLLQQIQRFANNKAFVDKIQYRPHNPGDVLMLTGIGEVFPFMRIHSLLEALQPECSDIPILVFYPGKYDGRFVRLFDRLDPNPYYRAFSIV